MAALEPRQVLPAHGPVIDDPIGLIERYSAHRASREREVLAAIESGADSVDAIVSAVYPAISGPLRLVAVETAHAHVNKLRDERRIEDDNGRLRVVSTRMTDNPKGYRHPELLVTPQALSAALDGGVSPLLLDLRPAEQYAAAICPAPCTWTSGASASSTRTRRR